MTGRATHACPIRHHAHNPAMDQVPGRRLTQSLERQIRDERADALSRVHGAYEALAQAHYAGRTFLRFVPDERFLSWNTRRIPLKG